MSTQLNEYREARTRLPESIQRWQLDGTGFDHLQQVTVGRPQIQAHELLVRHDACGICFSDIKIINLGPDHPRLKGRDFKSHPVVLGHECSVTVVEVGRHLSEQFAVGQRYIVQPDVYYKHVNMSYGYVLSGGMATYGVITREVLEGDEGCYLLPVKTDTGYAEAALVEPWACVVAAYEYANYRTGPLDQGKMLIVDIDGRGTGHLFVERHCHRPARTTVVKQPDDVDFVQLRSDETAGIGFDDIILLGATDGDQGWMPHVSEIAGTVVTRICAALGPRGIVNVVGHCRIDGPVAVDIGRVHYEQQLYIGGIDAEAAYRANARSDIKEGGSVLFIGAGGPMGQMHVQRALMMEPPPKRVVITDNNRERVDRLTDRFGSVALARGIELILLGFDGRSPSDYGPYDDIVNLVPSSELIVQTVPMLAQGGVYNIFAGINKGVTVEIDLGTMIRRNQRLIGTTGSSIADMRHALELVESGKLSTNAGLAAIGGLEALSDGLVAVREGRFPGKTVIFPTISGLPLTALTDLKDRLPRVHERLTDGRFWTREAEKELFRTYMAGE